MKRDSVRTLGLVSVPTGFERLARWWEGAEVRPVRAVPEEAPEAWIASNRPDALELDSKTPSPERWLSAALAAGCPTALAPDLRLDPALLERLIRSHPGAAERVVLLEPWLAHPLVRLAKERLDAEDLGEPQVLRFKRHGTVEPDAPLEPGKLCLLPHFLGPVRDAFAWSSPGVFMGSLRYAAEGRYAFVELAEADPLLWERMPAPADSAEEVLEITGTDGVLILHNPLGGAFQGPKLRIKRGRVTRQWDDETPFQPDALASLLRRNWLGLLRRPDGSFFTLPVLRDALRIETAWRRSLAERLPAPIKP